MSSTGFDFFEKRDIHVILAHKKVAQQWVKDQTYDVVKVAHKSNTPVDVLVNIAENAPYPIVKHFLKNRHATKPVLETILLNKSFSTAEVDEVAALLVKHRNVTPQILEQIFVYTENAISYDTLYHLVKNPKTPTHILIQFLPQNGAENMFTYSEILGACNNINMPHAEALVASKLLHYKDHGEDVWEKHYFPFLKEYHKNSGVNMNDWPEEWVATLIPGMKYPYPEQFEIDEI